jgi:hypothetical protein
VERRDLDRNYVSTYRKKMDEVWRVVGYDSTGRKLPESKEIEYFNERSIEEQLSSEINLLNEEGSGGDNTEPLPQ